MRLLGLIVVLVTAGPMVGCSVNPATGETILTLQSWDWEREVGAETAPQMTAEFGGEVPSAEARAYVTEVGESLLVGLEEGVPELQWEFTLLDSAVINAFALPGGKVFLSRGLADKLDSEAAMAGVLGHEIGHVTARHGNQRVSKQLGFNVLIGVGAAAVGIADEDTLLREVGTFAVPAMAVGGNLVLLKYGREEELEADELGMRYMARAGYDPVGQMRVMQTLKAASGGSSQPEWLSTHPASDTRIERIQEMLRGEFASTQNNPEYVTRPEVYQRRMLAELAQLPPPAHGHESSGQALLERPELWCMHCAVAAAE